MNEYSPITVCGDRALTVDVKTVAMQSGPGQPIFYVNYYQLVLKNPEVIGYFISRGAIAQYELNSNGEYILELGAETTGSNAYYGVRAGRSITVKIEGGSVALAAYSPAQQGSQLMAEFDFRDCR